MVEFDAYLGACQRWKTGARALRLPPPDDTGRHCYDLTYESRREDAKNRALSKAQEIRHRLGGSRNMLMPFPEKPKGMHWRTYERLLRKAHAAKHVYHVALMEWLEQSEARVEAMLAKR